MEKPLYSETIAVISSTELDFELSDKYTVFIGTIDECTLRLKQEELKNDALFSGIFIINSVEYLKETVDFLLAEKDINRLFENIFENNKLTYKIYFSIKLLTTE
jgi:hypothetical protein